VGDLLTQTVKVVRWLHDDRYALEPGAVPAAATGTSSGEWGQGRCRQFRQCANHHAPLPFPSADAGSDKSTAAKTAEEVREGKIPVGAGSRCGFITPRMWKLIIGRGHPEFCTNEQQDAAQFIAWMWDQLDKAHNGRPAQERVVPLADGSHSPSCFTGLQMQHRLLDMQSGGVRYTTTREWGMRIPIPTAAATNTAEVAAAKAHVAEAVAKAIADAADTVGGAVDAAAIVSDVMGPRPAKRARIDTSDAAAVAARRIADRVHAELAPSIPKVRHAEGGRHV